MVRWQFLWWLVAMIEFEKYDFMLWDVEQVSESIKNLLGRKKTLDSMC
jgi:hypothetical protein